MKITGIEIDGDTACFLGGDEPYCVAAQSRDSGETWELTAPDGTTVTATLVAGRSADKRSNGMAGAARGRPFSFQSSTEITGAFRAVSASARSIWAATRAAISMKGFASALSGAVATTGSPLSDVSRIVM